MFNANKINLRLSAFHLRYRRSIEFQKNKAPLEESLIWIKEKETI
jgi:hypothetical protein